MLNDPGLAVVQSDICLIFQNTCGKVADMKKAKEVFQITGIHSFNTDVFSDVDFSHQKSVISSKEPE
jgi:hypothetical protein